MLPFLSPASLAALRRASPVVQLAVDRWQNAQTLASLHLLRPPPAVIIPLPQFQREFTAGEVLGEGGYKVVFQADLWNGEKRALAVMDLQALRQNGANNRGFSHRSRRSGAAGTSRFAPLLALRVSLAVSAFPAGLSHFPRFFSASFQPSAGRFDRLFIRGNRGRDAS